MPVKRFIVGQNKAVLSCISKTARTACQNDQIQKSARTALYERLALSKDKKKVKQLARKGQIIENPEDAIRSRVFVEYALGGLSNKVFIAKYKLYLPSKKELEMEIKKRDGIFMIKGK